MLEYCILFFFIYILVNGFFYKILNRPPEPFKIPVIGNFYLCKPDPYNNIPPMHKIFYKLSRKYGKIFGFHFGNKYTIILSSPDVIREALKDNENETIGRFVPESMNIVTQGVGIALQPDIIRWKKCRNTLVSAVTAKRIDIKKEKTILSEIHDMVYFYRETQMIEFDFSKHSRRESINILMRMVGSFRFGKEMSKEYLEIEEIMGNIFQSISAGNPTDYIPILKYIGYGKDFIKKLKIDVDKRDNQINNWIKWHKNTVIFGEERDFIDIMLTQTFDKLSDIEIRSIIWDTMAGGIDTSALSFEWLIYILTNNPEVQDKIHHELDNVIGDNRLPVLNDIENLKYLNATLCELFRMKHFAPFGIPHQSLKDIKIGGYNIPKDTQIIYNLYTLHMDPNLWKNPHHFNPDRFMPGGEGEFLIDNYLHSDRIRTKYSKEPNDELFKFLPFGFGKRQCAGFGLGRIIMFLKTATHLHCFNWMTLNNKRASLDELFGVTLTPKYKYNIKVTERPAAKLALECNWKNIDSTIPGVLLE